MHTLSEVTGCGSSALVLPLNVNVESMKKVKPVAADELRPEYKREDFGSLVRGKYAARLKAASNVVVLKPEVAKAFPNADAVNNALMVSSISRRRPCAQLVAQRGRARKRRAPVKPGV